MNEQPIEKRPSTPTGLEGPKVDIRKLDFPGYLRTGEAPVALDGLGEFLEEELKPVSEGEFDHAAVIVRRLASGEFNVIVLKPTEEITT